MQKVVNISNRIKKDQGYPWLFFSPFSGFSSTVVSLTASTFLICFFNFSICSSCSFRVLSSFLILHTIHTTNKIYVTLLQIICAILIGRAYSVKKDAIVKQIEATKNTIIIFHKTLTFIFTTRMLFLNFYFLIFV